MTSIKQTHSGLFAPRVLLRAFVLFIAGAVLLCTAFLFFYRQESANENRIFRTEQRNLIQNEQNMMERALRSAMTDALTLAQLPALTQLTRHSGREALRPVEKFFLGFLLNKKVYDQVRFLDSAGRELVRANKGPESPFLTGHSSLQDKSERYYVREALKLGPGQVYVSLFDLNIEGGKIERPFKPTIRFVAPVHGAGGELKGLVILNYLGREILDKLRDFNKTSAAITLVDGDGYWLLGLDHRDEWGFMFKDRGNRKFPARFPDIWPEIAARNVGQFHAPEGLFTFAAVSSPSPHGSVQDWHLIAYVPAQAADAAVDTYLEQRLIILGALLLATACLAWILALAQVRRREDQERIHQDARNREVLNQLLNLRLSDQPLDKSLEQALDIIFSTSWLSVLPSGGVFIAEDAEKPVLRLRAQRNLKPEIGEMCALVPWGKCHCGRAAAEQKAQFSSHVGDDHENKYPGMADHGHYNVPLMKGSRCLGVLLLYLPAGYVRVEAETAFLDAVGGVLAGIIDSRASEKALRENEARMKAIVNTAVEGIVTIDSAGIVQSFNPAAEEIFGYKAAEAIGNNVKMLAPEPARSRHDGFIRNYLETGQAKVIGIGRETEGQRKDGTRFPLYLSVSEVRLGAKILFTGILRDITELKQTQQRLRKAKEHAEGVTRELLEKQRLLDEDLKAAAGIQKTLLPEEMPYIKEIELAWKFIPSQHIGGDIFSATMLDPENLCLYMLDVSGHGVPAALVTVSVHEMLEPESGHVVTDYGSNEATITLPIDLMNALERDYPLERFEKFFTIFYMLLNIKTGRLVYSNAAHPPPLLLKTSGEIISLDIGGTIIGMGGDVPFEQAELFMEPGDRLLCYTDGVLEHRAPHGEMFNIERLQNAWRSHQETSLNAAVESVWKELHEFGREADPEDDVSLLALKFKGL